LRTFSASWLFWALLSAIFAAVTAIFGEIGVANVNSDLATLVSHGRDCRHPRRDSRTHQTILAARSRRREGIFLACYFRALKLGDAVRVALVDKLSIVLVAVFGAAFLGERLTAANCPASS